MSRVQAHTGQRHGEQGTDALGRVQDRGVLFPRPCLWLRDFLVPVLSGQATLLRKAALRAGITQCVAPPKSAWVVLRTTIYNSCLYGGLWLQESEHTHWAVGRRSLLRRPLRSNNVQLSPPDRYGPTLTFAHRASKTTKLSRLHPLAVIHLWKPRGYTEVSYMPTAPPRSHHPARVFPYAWGYNPADPRPG